MRILGTFQSRDAADGVKDAFLKEGFQPGDLIVMVNRETAEPPEDARLEVGTEGASGFAGLEEKIGKAVLDVLHKPAGVDGDGSEGQGKAGALLGITVRTQAEAERVRALLERHFASDVEVAEED